MAKKTPENRRFRRYRKKFSAKVSDGRNDRQAEIIDYSLDGIGLLLKQALPLGKGDLLTLDNEELSIHGDCKVEWASKTPGGMKLGLQRLSPMSGDLANFRLADILIGLQRSMKSGTLRIVSGTIEKSIYFRNGSIVFARSNQQHERLGDLLLREGRITQSAYDVTTKLMSVTGKKQGTLLIEIKAMSPDDLSWAVHHQVEKILLGLFCLAEATFEFLEGALPEGKLIQLRLPSGHLIYKGLKQPEAAAQLVDYSGLPDTAIIAFSSNPLNLFQDIPFDDEDRLLLSLIDGKRTIAEIRNLAELDDAVVRKSIAALINIAILEVVEEASKTGAHPFEFVVSRSQPPEGLLESIEDMHSRLPELDHYALLGLNETASEAELRTAFYRTAKEFHPDRHYYFDEDVAVKLYRIFSQITKAYTVLSSPEQRSAYNRSLAEQQPDGSRSQRAESRFQEGCDYYAQHRADEAAQCFEESICLEPGVAKYHFFHGLALKDLSRIREAERALSRSCKIVPTNDECHTELGLIYLKLGQRMRAKMSFIKALQHNRANQRAKEGLLSLT